MVFNDYMNTLMGDPTTEKLLPLIDAAAEAGVDYFCIDAGWYAEGHWWDTVGAWQPAESRFPGGGLIAVIDHIRARGLQAGLWLEPEVIGIRSPLAASLPDAAFFSRGGVRIAEHGRHLLDLRHPAALAHLDEVVDRIVGDYGVRFIKMDYNTMTGPGTDSTGSSPGQGLLEHNRALLGWIDRVQARHPRLIIENCASGAMRMDYAMLSRLHLQSTSDQQDPVLYAPDRGERSRVNPAGAGRELGVPAGRHGTRTADPVVGQRHPGPDVPVRLPESDVRHRDRRRPRGYRRAADRAGHHRAEPPVLAARPARVDRRVGRSRVERRRFRRPGDVPECVATPRGCGQRRPSPARPPRHELSVDPFFPRNSAGWDWDWDAGSGELTVTAGGPAPSARVLIIGQKAVSVMSYRSLHSRVDRPGRLGPGARRDLRDRHSGVRPRLRAHRPAGRRADRRPVRWRERDRSAVDRRHHLAFRGGLRLDRRRLARHDLVAAGLDTIATIEVNGVVVGRTQNQHRSYRFDIGGVLHAGRNTIAVEFAAPVPTALARSVEHGPRPHANHHPYNAIRKMACNFGWDWGIDVATSGIWKAIGIESWSGVRIASVRPLVGIDGETGILTAHVELERVGTGRHRDHRDGRRAAGVDRHRHHHRDRGAAGAGRRPLVADRAWRPAAVRGRRSAPPCLRRNRLPAPVDLDRPGRVSHR